jgi:3-deoxy-D-manno-octulosonic-acid transferase
MNWNITQKTVFKLYDLVWALASPALRLNSRLAEGFEQRTLRKSELTEADLWIQAASVGEAYLVWSILKTLDTDSPIRILLTSNTSQGIEILKKAVYDIKQSNPAITPAVTYFPFDRPSIVKKAVRNINPGVMVLLETEIWPGLLSALKENKSRILIINGRISPKSLSMYLKWPSFWKALSPDKVLAISKDDAFRFATLFGGEHVGTMRNIKFDRVENSVPLHNKCCTIKALIPDDTPLFVLGSIRREEEPSVEKIIAAVHRRIPGIIIALFPRHTQRVKSWCRILERMNITWVLRSATDSAVSKGTVIIWDTFGELLQAYGRAKAVLVGGSLASLGGQNFLEPLICGVFPVIGPSWENFAWVGNEIIEQNLLRIAGDWKEAADMLVGDISGGTPRDKIREKALEYIKDRQGGTAQACDLIKKSLDQCRPE